MQFWIDWPPSYFNRQWLVNPSSWLIPRRSVSLLLSQSRIPLPNNGRKYRCENEVLINKGLGCVELLTIMDKISKQPFNRTERIICVRVSHVTLQGNQELFIIGRILFLYKSTNADVTTWNSISFNTCSKNALYFITTSYLTANMKIYPQLQCAIESTSLAFYFENRFWHILV